MNGRSAIFGGFSCPLGLRIRGQTSKRNLKIGDRIEKSKSQLASSMDKMREIIHPFAVAGRGMRNEHMDFGHII